VATHDQVESGGLLSKFLVFFIADVREAPDARNIAVLALYSILLPDERYVPAQSLLNVLYPTLDIMSEQLAPQDAEIMCWQIAQSAIRSPGIMKAGWFWR
jgi:hypothetical protein